MRLKIFFSFLFIILFVFLLAVYWFVPLGDVVSFDFKPKNYNFSINGEDMQFYSNLRFKGSDISYNILDCPLSKKNDMEYAFDIVSNKTRLSFYPVASGEEISITCDDSERFEGGLFIAGEGGPINITKTENFNVILHGKILLIRESTCERPNIAIHELFHVLGFKHSNNLNNIMYNISKCSQIIGEDNINLIDQLYSIPSYPDLSFENIDSSMVSRYLDTNISIRNNGLRESEMAKIIIYADGKNIKEIELKPIDIGYGITISLTNIFINKLNVDSLEYVIDSDFDEIDRENNRAVLKIK